MRPLNVLMLDAVSVAMAATSSGIELEHMIAYDATAVIAVANPADKAASAVSAAADTWTIAAHGYLTGMKCTLTTTGTLPAGLATATPYYVIVVDANTIKFASSQANALAGTAIDQTDAGTGTHTVAVTTTIAGSVKLQKCNDPDEVPDASKTWFDVPSSSQSFSAAGSLNWTGVDVGYRRLRAVAAVTSGTVTVSLRLNAKGV